MSVTDPNPFTVRNFAAGTFAALVLSFAGCAEDVQTSEPAAPAPVHNSLPVLADDPEPPSFVEPEPEPEPEVPPTLTGDAAVIAACESGGRLADGTALLGTHDWEAQNSTSTASGAFQFINGTWEWTWEALIGEPAPTVRARDATPKQQLRAFRALWSDRSGSAHWEPSATCWNQMLK